jgi:hypothetical protein
MRWLKFPSLGKHNFTHNIIIYAPTQELKRTAAWRTIKMSNTGLGIHYLLASIIITKAAGDECALFINYSIVARRFILNYCILYALCVCFIIFIMIERSAPLQDHFWFINALGPSYACRVHNSPEGVL